MSPERTAMPVSMETESLLSLSEASRYLPDRPHVSTLHRWRLRGIRGIKLETILVGGRRYTSREALERFTVAVTAAASGEVVPVSASRARTQAIERAERELDAAGL